MPKTNYRLVLVTAPNAAVARKIARCVLGKHLIACANILPGVESLYWWKNQIEKGSEVLMLMKTTRAKLADLEKEVLANHPYDTPEFLVLKISDGNKRYLKWLSGSLAIKAPKSKVRKESL